MFDRNVTAAPHIILSQRPITFADIYLQLNSPKIKGRNLFKLFQQWRNCLIYIIRTLATCEFLYFIFPPVVDWNLFLMYRLCLVFFVCVAGLAYGRKRSLCYPKKKKMKMEMNLNTKCKEAAFFVGRWDRGDTHTRVYTYMQSGWIESPPVYVCVCCCVFSLMPVMDLFLFLLFSGRYFSSPSWLGLEKKNHRKRVFLSTVSL